MHIRNFRPKCYYEKEILPDFFGDMSNIWPKSYFFGIVCIFCSWILLMGLTDLSLEKKDSFSYINMLYCVSKRRLNSFYNMYFQCIFMSGKRKHIHLHTLCCYNFCRFVQLSWNLNSHPFLFINDNDLAILLTKQHIYLQPIGLEINSFKLINICMLKLLNKNLSVIFPDYY